MESEVDLSAFLARQRLGDPPGGTLVSATLSVDDDDVDHSVAHISSNPLAERHSRKGKVQQINWDASLEKMQHDKNVAQAQSGVYIQVAWVTKYAPVADALFPSDLKERFRASAAHQMGKTATREHARRQGWIYVLYSRKSLTSPMTRCPAKSLKEDPLLQQDPHFPPKSPTTEVEDFLDDLLD